MTGRAGQVRVSVWWREHALITIEVNLVGKCPPLPEAEGVLVLLKKNLRLDISGWACFHQQIIVVLHPIEHSRVICHTHKEKRSCQMTQQISSRTRGRRDDFWDGTHLLIRRELGACS
ncbi:hypothetical protein SAY86_020251 [Trapa natans]|uniref:Uncharacterized protein n=1 Tax=Trapa natans TaxID=22666 RepID=A0AAN7LZ24_TRANT|nr:hypothetical protein SAY86_020251 [Trapa natans]